jgi:hypothetical protein
VVANCDHLQALKFSPGLPKAFTEHGAIMVASFLNTPRAMEVRSVMERRPPPPRPQSVQTLEKDYLTIHTPSLTF